MEDKAKIEELVKMLDASFANGVGHINVDTNDEPQENVAVQTLGCTDCSRTPLACSVPTLQQGLDDYK